MNERNGPGPRPRIGLLVLVALVAAAVAVAVRVMQSPGRAGAGAPLVERAAPAAPAVLPDPSAAAAPVPLAADELGSAPGTSAADAATAPAAASGTPSAAPAEPAAEPESMHARVLDEAGHPVDRARVRVWSGAEATGGPPLLERLTDPTGRCTLEIPSPECMVHAEHADVGTSQLWKWKWFRGARDASGESVFTLRPAIHISGQVLAADGAPAPGAIVSMWSGESPAALLPPTLAVEVDGRFELDTDAGEQIGFEASVGDLRSDSVSVLAQPGERVEIMLRLPGDWEIAGVVLDPQGKAVPAASVMAWYLLPGVDVSTGRAPDLLHNVSWRETVTADDTGGFRLQPLHLGDYVLIASADGFPPSDEVRLTLDAADPRAQVTIPLLPPATIRGHVVWDTGRPGRDLALFAAVGTSWSPSAAFFAPGPLERFGRSWVTTADDGAFELGPLHPRGVYRISVHPRDDGSDTWLMVRDVPANTTDLRLVLTEAGTRRGVIDGTVASAATGELLTSFYVDTAYRSKERGWVEYVGKEPVTGEPGRFKVGGLRVGDEYSLMVGSRGYARALVGPWTEEGGERALEVRLTGTGSLEAVVLDAHGRPAPRAWVEAERTDAVFQRMRRSGAWTDSEGRALVKELEPGRWLVSARAGIGGQSPPPVSPGAEERDIVEGETAFVQLSLAE